MCRNMGTQYTDSFCPTNLDDKVINKVHSAVDLSEQCHNLSMNLYTVPF